MTPREKAVELYEKFDSYSQTESTHIKGWTKHFNKCSCALVCIDEVLKQLDAETWGLEMDRAFDQQQYWNEVKQEIKKL